VAQVVEHPLSKHKAMSSNASATKPKPNQKKKKKKIHKNKLKARCSIPSSAKTKGRKKGLMPNHTKINQHQCTDINQLKEQSDK
jgi:hypothetical protein